MANRRGRVDEPQAIDPEVDRYPRLDMVLRAVLAEEGLPEGPIERLEVTCLASGEATWRVWLARAESAEGGYFAKL